MSGTDTPLLEIDDLAIAYDGKEVVHGVSLSVRAGEVVALVGESGSGKTSTAQAVIGLLAENGRIARGAIRLNGVDISQWGQKRLDAVRGSQISLIPQDPTTSLNPIKTIGAQVSEILEIHGQGTRAGLRPRVVELLAQVGLPDPALRYGQYPHELSGGMRQRVLIAIAIALRPQLIIADEPTSALDVTVQKHVLDLIGSLQAQFGTAVLLVTHDLAVAGDRARRIVVMQQGRVQEQGATAAILGEPQNAYTRQLLADAPSIAKPRPERRPRADADKVVVVDALVQEFPTPDGKRFLAVDNVSFEIRRGTTHAIVGESGSGKTTTARNVVGFQTPTAGSIRLDGQEVVGLAGEARRQLRRKVQLVHQNPFSSLDPRQTIYRIVEEPLRNFDAVPRAERDAAVRRMLDQVGLPADVLDRRPRALSGGQRQRVAIARALILNPEVVVLDEAVSALDVTVQAQILRLLNALQDKLGLTYLFISHDLAVVRQISDTVTVMQHGRIVDSGPVSEVFAHPTSPYTRELIEAVPGRRLPQDA